MNRCTGVSGRTGTVQLFLYADFLGLSCPTTTEEHCFALNAASLIDNALSIKYIGGTYANQKPTEFMCLALKLLQLQPEREIILEYLRAEEFK